MDVPAPRASVGLAVAFVASALFHAAAALLPRLDPGSPTWRHALFVAINGAVAWGLLARPRGFVVGFAALTAQQLYSHGRDLALALGEGRADVASLAVVVVMPSVLVALTLRRL